MATLAGTEGGERVIYETRRKWRVGADGSLRVTDEVVNKPGAAIGVADRVVFEIPRHAVRMMIENASYQGDGSNRGVATCEGYVGQRHPDNKGDRG